VVKAEDRGMMEGAEGAEWGGGNRDRGRAERTEGAEGAEWGGNGDRGRAERAEGAE
jgi:hypothetical protein